ncbi:DUF45 domain-containing protein [Acinetobacter sp. B5B]|uniref:YgjP-like metallopeptidase domain-containing protein n=1 Tax=Acinetobacter baretiae TaxID=2605383 RepID=UPI0018C30168|nr:YgjP-like metallopeptidase domain-containing protein [Acinetobacter baretiae]MBF7683122.1 DUF45 domain-containing protein [Acinetobacter baretiae]
MELKNALHSDFEYLHHLKRVRHATARRLRLTVHADHIRLTVPKRCSEQLVKQFLAQSHDWLVQTWQQQTRRSLLNVDDLPKTLHLFNLDEPVAVVLVKMSHTYDYHHQIKVLHLNSQSPFKSLKAFLCAYAREHLPVYLKTVSTQTGLDYQAVQIRYVKTRWGSCNSQHKIMLNVLLVLLQRPHVRYICIHELVHTAVFNHSLVFWEQVAKYDVDYMKHHQVLKKNVWPNWVYIILGRL